MKRKQLRQRRKQLKRKSLKSPLVFLKKELALAWLLLCVSLFCDAQNKKILAITRNMQALAEMQESAQNYWLNSNIHTLEFNDRVKRVTLISYRMVSTRENEELKNSFDSSIYTFDKAGRELSFAYYTNGQLLMEKKKEYDNAGRLVFSKDDANAGKYITRTDYEYNSIGKLISENRHSEKKLATRDNYIYDKSGQRILRKITVNGNNDTIAVLINSYAANGEKKAFEKYVSRRKTKSIRYEYDRQGRLSIITDTSFLNTMSDGRREYADTLVKRRKLLYDKKDNVTKEEETAWNRVWQRREISNYPIHTNDSSAVKEEVMANTGVETAAAKRYEYYKSPGDEFDTTIIKYAYDRHSNLELAQMDHNSMRTIIEFNYTYDSKNNWIAIRYSRNGKLVREISRRIEY